MNAEEFLNIWHDENDYITATTSGSTGKPKEIKLPKRLVEESARRTIKFFGIDEESLLWLPLSPDYIAGKMMIVRADISGAHLVVEKPSNYPLADYSGRKRISLVAVVPSQIPGLLMSDAIDKVDCLLVGGGPVNESIIEKLQVAGISAFESYGMTETASHVALRRISPETEDFFTPLEGICISLSTDGCLVIKSDSQSEVVTNDLAHLLPDGRFRILGRADHAIITGGVKVHPAEVERKAASVMSGYNWYISSTPDTLWGEKVVAVIEGKKLDYSREEALLRGMREILAPAEVPKAIIYVLEFDYTDSGKLIRRKF